VQILRNLFLFILPLFFACAIPDQGQKKETKNVISFKIEELDSPSDASIRGIWVLDSNCIWLSGAKGTVLRSLNSGESWQLLPPPDQDSLDFRDIHAFSKESALIVSAGYPARVYLTKDAGENWELVYENLDSSAFMNSVHFKDSKNGLIVGDKLNDYHFLLMTADGGRSWDRVDSTKIAKPLKIEHAFAASGSCITVNEAGNYVVAFGGEKSRVLRQANDQWIATELAIDDSSASSGVYSIASGAGKLMTAGGDYTKEDEAWHAFYSEDGGETWQSTASKYRGYRSVVAYSPLMELWLAAGSNGVDLFYPEHRIWSKVSDKSINTLQFDQYTPRAWAAGPDGSIYRINFKR
tara:strand:+ start:936 stop:1991 length:1056 start_codon:yes stop_codon:yes gene_type:complete